MLQAQYQEQQEELFAEREPAGKRRRNKYQPLFPLTRWTFSLSYEQLVLGAVACVLIGLVIFSLGAERGKRLAMVSSSAAPTARVPARRLNTAVAFAENMPASLAPRPTPTPATAPMVKATPSTPVPLTPLKSSPTAATSKAQVPSASNRAGAYTIQVATFRQRALADEEMRLLRQRGYQPFLVTSTKFSALCVGVYSTRQEAIRYLAALKSSYRDSFVRQR